MKTFKDYLGEAKQVGNIHHFTTLDSLHNMLSGERAFHLHSRNGENISFIRNPQLPAFNKNFKMCHVRITVDGDALSNHHKIRPVAGLADDSSGVLNISNTNRVHRFSGEAEETAVKHPLNILPYIRHIHIINHAPHHDVYEHLIKPKLHELQIPHSYDKSFTLSSLKEDDLFLSWESYYELL